eukprot:Nitzschia sp. Nitz4//scaffold9_size221794//55570//56967//NITZ4_001332-RA/size221794-processed-gene-0.316-mRNA-1//-1//CDS//3329560959//940//frame0
MGRRKRGEGGYIRIQNNSSVAVEIKVVEGRNVDDMGMDKIVGTIAPCEQLPTEGKMPFADDDEDTTGAVYQYIEGEVRNRFQKDGYFHLEAHPEDGTACSQLTLVVDRNSWEAKDNTPDEQDSSVKLVADVDEEDGDWKLELRVFDNYNPKKWMEEYGEKHDLGSRKLCEVAIPGTHDSGTYKFDKEKGASSDSGLTKVESILDHGRLLGKLNDAILENVFERLCRCQTLSIQGQLEMGIRYFDLRVAYHADSGRFLTCHGVYCVDMEEILQEVANFLAENSKEIVLLEFKKLFDMEQEQHEALTGMIHDILGDKLANRDECNQLATVQEFWDKGYQAVVCYDNGEVALASDGTLWPLRRHLESPWPNAGDTNDLHEKLKEKVVSNEGKRFFVMQGILTPDADLIKSELWESGGVSIKSIAKKCSGKVVDWVEEWKPSTKLNVVIVDYVEDCSILPAVINANKSM